MTFVFPILLGGLLLVGVPILLHLIMRQKPKTLPFPAFRFLLQRHKTNLRKLQLRHLLLLALRILVIAAVCLALARPKLHHAGLALRGDQPVAAILVFDTSASMEYRTSDGPTRLDEARKRGLELLDELPEGSRVAILDTAEMVQSGRGEWLLALNQARERIGALKIQPANAPVTHKLEQAYRMFAELAATRDDDKIAELPRFLCVLSDRTRAGWETARIESLQEEADRVPPSLGGLQQTHEGIPTLLGLLGDLRTRLPLPPGKDYADQSLAAFLNDLRERIPSLTPADLPPDQPLRSQVAGARQQGRRLLATLDVPDEGLAPEAREFRDRLRSALHTTLGHLRGVHGVFVDMGVESPVDLALVDLEFPRRGNGQIQQTFARDETILLQAVVRATGKDLNGKLVLSIHKKTWEQAVSVKAGERKAHPFEIDCGKLQLGSGPQHLEAHLEPRKDQLTPNNVRFASFAIREPRRILVLTDNPAKASTFGKALESLNFTVDVKSPVDLTKSKGPKEMRVYRAVFLLSVASPDERLWTFLQEYVALGGGLGIIPGGPELQLSAYNEGAARKLMPGQLEGIVEHKSKDPLVTPGVHWDLSPDNIFQHELMRPLQTWKGNSSIDFMRFPRKTWSYWKVRPAKDAVILVNYADEKRVPALLERLLGTHGRPGKVLLFTTTLDDRQPAWHNYLENSFFFTLTGYLATGYLAGETQEERLNFLSGQTEPVVVLPLERRFPVYRVRREGDTVLTVTVDENQRDLLLKQIVAPGSYVVVGGTGDDTPASAVGGFSVNVPPEESDLTRVPIREVEDLLGGDAVVPVERQTPLRESLRGHWSQPLELFPFLMMLLLLLLAVENLLGNRFYRKESTTHGGETR
jgi:hypothetical protein